MPHAPTFSFVRAARLLGGILLALALGACASLSGHDPLNVNLVGIDPLPGEGLEMRFALKLRVQNPNDRAMEYDGIALALEVNDRPLATGVSDQKGRVPRFGEKVLSVPMSVSAFAALRQALGLSESARLDDLPYVLRGKLGGGTLGTIRFTDKGTLDLPTTRGTVR